MVKPEEWHGPVDYQGYSVITLMIFKIPTPSFSDLLRELKIHENSLFNSAIIPVNYFLWQQKRALNRIKRIHMIQPDLWHRSKEIEFLNDYGLLTAKPCMYAVNMNKLHSQTGTVTKWIHEAAPLAHALHLKRVRMCTFNADWGVTFVAKSPKLTIIYTASSQFKVHNTQI